MASNNRIKKSIAKILIDPTRMTFSSVSYSDTEIAIGKTGKIANEYTSKTGLNMEIIPITKIDITTISVSNIFYNLYWKNVIVL
jgi:hypothetical protein